MVANGTLAGAEIAVVSIRKTRLDQLVAEGKAGARALKRLRKDPEAFLATAQIGITLIGTTAGAFGGHSLALEIQPYISRIPGLSAHAAENVALALVIAALSFLELVVGELVPKSLALRSADRFGLLVSRPLWGISWVLRPLVWFFTASSNLILRLFGDKTTFTEARLSPGEIQQIVDEATEAGSVDRHAGEIASRAIDFADLTAGHVMVQRRRVVGIPRDAKPDKIKEIVLEHGRTRMPVYDEVIDNVIGYVTIRDLMALLVENQLLLLEDAIRPAFKVPEDKRAVELLQEMRQRRVQLAIVVDEAGATAGIVTIEDLVEELVGEIASEHEEEEVRPILIERPGAALVLGDVPIRDLNRELDLELEESESWSTVAGLCLELAGRIPSAGERFKSADGTEIEVVTATPRQVKRVRLVFAKKREEES